MAHISNVDWESGKRGSFESKLYESHGYHGLSSFVENRNVQDIVRDFPLNLPILNNAKGVISHSAFSRSLAQSWYGNCKDNNWDVLPLLRVSKHNMNKKAARDALRIDTDCFLICTFGLLGPSKLNSELLDAWLASELSKNINCILVFV
ncbi:hypothetical protein, partial [Chromobacterium sp. ASV23]|uniref:hypothetical protein n=1 Tax=Chromobacterium sp. ASV23 TaxID=2795110 RepID=UPI001E43FBE8